MLARNVNRKLVASVFTFLISETLTCWFLSPLARSDDYALWKSVQLRAHSKMPGCTIE